MSSALNANNEVVKQKIEVIDAALLQRQALERKQKQEFDVMHYHSPQGFSANSSNYHYRIQPQDVIQIVLWNEGQGASSEASAGAAMTANNVNMMGLPPTATVPNFNTQNNANNLSNTFIVNSHGQIFYPYLGFIAVGGKTVTEIQTLMSEKVKHYLHNPQITVQVVGFNSQKVAVTGAVRSPANLPVTNVPLTVLSAVTLAGGPMSCGGVVSASTTSFCADLKNVKIVRGNQTVFVDLDQLKAINGSSNNWILKNGDIIFIPSLNASRIFVLGAVNVPGPYNMIDGKMTLRDALGDADGVNSGASPAYTYVIRNYQQNPRVYVLNIGSPDALNLAGDFDLKPNDVVFVSTSVLQDVNGIINQFSPTIATAAYINSLTR